MQLTSLCVYMFNYEYSADFYVLYIQVSLFINHPPSRVWSHLLESWVGGSQIAAMVHKFTSFFSLLAFCFCSVTCCFFFFSFSLKIQLGKYLNSVTLQTPFSFYLSLDFIVQVFLPLAPLLLPYCFCQTFSLSSVYAMHLHYIVELQTSLFNQEKWELLSVALKIFWHKL